MVTVPRHTGNREMKSGADTLITASKETFFSSASFINSICRAPGAARGKLAIATGCGSGGMMYGTQTLEPFPLRRIWLAPFGLPASPGWDGQLSRNTLRGILSRLTSPRTVSIVWNVRFDHLELAQGLMQLGFKCKRLSTHILPLWAGYDRVFAGYNATIRNQVRKAHRAGIQVRQIHETADIKAYYDVHEALAKQKGGYGQLHPLELFVELAKDRESVKLLIAEHEGKTVAGGLFFVDGCSVMYWHGASDRNYSRLFPSFAVIDAAIQWAAQRGAVFFNFGSSNAITSLEQFKSFWGATVEFNQVCVWRHPLWRALGSTRSALARYFHAGRGEDLSMAGNDSEGNR